MRCITLTRATFLCCTREAKFRNALPAVSGFPVVLYCGFFGFAWRLPDGSGYLSDFRMVIFRRFPHADVPLPVGLYRGFCRFSYCDVPAFRRVVFCFFRQRTVPFVRAALFAGVCPAFFAFEGVGAPVFSFFAGGCPFFAFAGTDVPVFLFCVGTPDVPGFLLF